MDSFVLQRTLPLRPEDSLVRAGFAEAGRAVIFRGCIHCGLIFRVPRPSEQQLNHYYSMILPPLEPDIMGALGVTRELADSRNDRRYAELFEEIRAHLPTQEPGHIIDLGGWDGRSLVPWRRAGWQATLVEPGCKTRPLVDADIRAVETPRDGVLLPNPLANVITSYHCIEHLLDIGSSLLEARRLSKPGTLWVVEVPFDIIYVHGLLGSTPLAEPQIHEQHLSFFTVQSIRSVARFLGLALIRARIVVTPYWFGPTISIRMYARDLGGTGGDGAALHAFGSERAMRRHLTLRMLAWRRWAGLKFRAFRWLERLASAPAGASTRHTQRVR